MWQNNVSWTEGLFSEVTVGRLGRVKATTEYDPVFAVYERIDKNNANDWYNLKLKRFLMPQGETIGTLEGLFASYYVVAVDTRLRAYSSVCTFTTRRSIVGSVDVTIEYEVKDVQLLMRVEDPLLALKKRVEQTVQDIAFDLGYPRLTSTDIRRALLALDTEREIGIVLYNPLCGAIQWPTNIQDLTASPVIDDLRNQNQDNRNAYRRKKLEEMGITDPYIVTSVLSQDDTDLQVIMQHVQSYASAQQDSLQKQLQLLEWLEERNYITRADMQRLVTPLLDQISNQTTISRRTANSFLSSGQAATDHQLTSGSKDDDTANRKQVSADISDDTTPSQAPQTNANRRQPTVTRRRTVDSDDSFDTIPPISHASVDDKSSEQATDSSHEPEIKRRRSISFSDPDQNQDD